MESENEDDSGWNASQYPPSPPSIEAKDIPQTTTTTTTVATDVEHSLVSTPTTNQTLVLRQQSENKPHLAPIFKKPTLPTTSSATTTVFRKPLPRYPKTKSLSSTTMVQGKTSHSSEHTMHSNNNKHKPSTFAPMQQQPVVPNANDMSSLCSFTLSNLQNYDLLFFRAKLAKLLEQTKTIPLFRASGFREFVAYSYVVYSNRPLLNASMFFHDVRLFDIGDTLLSLYVCAWTHDTTSSSTIICFNDIFTTKPQLGMDLLHFTLCVKRNIVTHNLCE